MSGLGFADVSGEDERGIFGAVVGLPEACDVVACDGLDAVGVSDGPDAVGMVSIEGVEAHAEDGGYGLVAFLQNGDEALFADALDLFRGKAGCSTTSDSRSRPASVLLRVH